MKSTLTLSDMQHIHLPDVQTRSVSGSKRAKNLDLKNMTENKEEIMEKYIRMLEDKIEYYENIIESIRRDTYRDNERRSSVIAENMESYHKQKDYKRIDHLDKRIENNALLINKIQNKVALELEEQIQKMAQELKQLLTEVAFNSQLSERIKNLEYLLKNKQVQQAEIDSKELEAIKELRDIQSEETKELVQLLECYTEKVKHVRTLIVKLTSKTEMNSSDIQEVKACMDSLNASMREQKQCLSQIFESIKDMKEEEKCSERKINGIHSKIDCVLHDVRNLRDVCEQLNYELKYKYTSCVANTLKSVKVEEDNKEFYNNDYGINIFEQADKLHTEISILMREKEENRVKFEAFETDLKNKNQDLQELKTQLDEKHQEMMHTISKIYSDNQKQRAIVHDLNDEVGYLKALMILKENFTVPVIPKLKEKVVKAQKIDDLKKCMLLLKSNLDENDIVFTQLETVADSHSFMFTAAENGFMELILLFLVNGVPVDHSLDICRHTFLHGAALGGQINLVYLLLVKGADVNIKTLFKVTPLHRAIEHGHIDVVKLLVRNGADLNAKNSGGITPLHVAAMHKYNDLVQYLVNVGCDVTIRDSVGKTALDHAKEKGNAEIVTIIDGM